MIRVAGGAALGGLGMSVRLEKEGGVGIIVLDRPPANAYDYAFLREFAGAIDDARMDLGIRSAIVVTSASEKFFSAGADGTLFSGGPARARLLSPLSSPPTFSAHGNTTHLSPASLCRPPA